MLPIYDGLYDTPEIGHFLVRHEQAAASMAAAYAQLTGEAAVCLVTAGPGATNLATNVAEAFVGALPMVILAGRGATATTFRGASQEVDTELVFRPMTKWAERVDRADLIPDVLHEAFAIARNGKPGPVYLDLPRDICWQKIKFASLRACRPAARAWRRAGTHPRRSRAVCAGETSVDRRRRRHDRLRRIGGIAAMLAEDFVGAGDHHARRPRRDRRRPSAVGRRVRRASQSAVEAAARRGRRDPVARRALRGDGNQLAARICALAGRARTFRSTSTPPRSAAACRRNLRSIGDIRSVLEADARGHPPGGAGGRCRRSSTMARPKATPPRSKRSTAEIAELAASQEKPIHPLRVIRAVRQALPREATVAIDVGCSRAAHGRLVSGFSGASAAQLDRAVELLWHGLRRLGACRSRGRSIRIGPPSASSATARFK